MKKEEIHLWDVKRILLGDVPPEFLLEVLIRSVIVYVIAIIVVRGMGKRMNGQHTVIELAVMVMMGAIISLPMQAPDRGILQGVLILFFTLFMLRAVNWLGFKYGRLERLFQGELVILVKDGVLQKDVQEKTKITNQQVFEVLRSKEIYNLARVKRMYVEASGIFSVYKEEKEKHGLSMYPQIDETIYESYEAASSDDKACSNCGIVQPSDSGNCPNCGKDDWVKAIL